MLYARIAGVAGVRLQIISRALALQVLLIVAVVPAAEATVIHLTTGGPIHPGDPASFSTTVTPNFPGDTLSYTWNINNQGNLGGAISGANPTVTWAQLNALGVTGNGSVPVSVQVADLDPNFYVPSGVQTNVPVSSLEGWTLAYVDTYNTIMSTDTVLAHSTKPYMMLAARATGSNTLLLLGLAPRASVITDTGAVQSPPTNIANGIRWYFNSAWSWGFAPQGDSVHLFTADTILTPDGNLRLSWDTTGTSGGYRAGSITGLQTSTAYERLVYQSDGPTASASDSGSFSVVVAMLTGDYNGDGVVDAGDYVWWRKNDGSPTGYNSWRTNFGRTGGATSGMGGASVPEPMSGAMMVMALMVFVGRSQLCRSPENSCTPAKLKPASCRRCGED